MIFQGDTYQPNAFQLYDACGSFDNSSFGNGFDLFANCPSLINFKLTLSEIRSFTYLISAQSDNQASMIANQIRPSAIGLPNNVVLRTGPVQKKVNIISIIDAEGLPYPNDFTIKLLPTPMVSYTTPITAGKLYMADIVETRVVLYSFVSTVDLFGSVVSSLNPSSSSEPKGGRKTIPAIPTIINVLHLLDITSGSSRTVFINSNT